MVERFDLVQYEHFDQLDRAVNGDWVRYSDHLAIIGRIEDDRTDEHVQWMAELSALKKQVEELTAERDDARRYAVEARLRENQAEDRRVSESFARTKAEAEVAALRKALEPFVALADKRDAHYRRRGGNCDKFPDAHPSYDIDAGKRELPMGVWRAARAALTSTKETGDAG